MGEKYLVDTNTAIDYLGSRLPKNASVKLNSVVLEISVITRMELLAWPDSNSEQLSVLEDFIKSVTVWNLDEPIILKGIEVRKNYKIKLPDAIIAATAIVFDLYLVTRNIHDFKNIDGLRIINPWDLSEE